MSAVPCPRCGESVSGKFCSHCGSAVAGATCPNCKGALTADAQFCHHCGTAMSGTASSGAATGGGSRLPWIVAGIALVVVIALVLVQTASKKDEGGSEAGGAPLAGPMGGGAGGGMPSAGDISSMSPQERADRLFNRVMRYASEGKSDSAGIFAPMAIQSFEMMAPLDVHQRFDLGLVAVVTGDAPRARAEADTILKKNPNDLLGLTLAVRAAEAAKDAATRTSFEKRLIAAEPAERKSPRQEYVAHSSDIDAALKDAQGRKP
jgi:hypothetical protein